MKVVMLAAALLAGCGGGGEKVKGPSPVAPDTVKLTSPAFGEGQTIPRQLTCDGDNLSPPLHWSKPPQAAKELALLMEDPDAPGGTFVHWLVYRIRLGTQEIVGGQAPSRSIEAKNSFGDAKYGGPCPPKGDMPHRYVFTIYALGKSIAPETNAEPGKIRDAIAKAALARGQLTAKYGR